MGEQTNVVSPLRLVKWCVQWQPMSDWSKVPPKLRGTRLPLQSGEFA
jgi:hypothetical protein